VASMRGISFVMGKMSLDAGLVAALIQRSGRYDYRVLTHTADECRLAFYDGGKAVGESRFTMADASAADLKGKDMWKKYPKNMLFARALTNGARWYCPGVYFGAVYSGDELADAPEPPAITVIPPEAKPVNMVDAAPEIPYTSNPESQAKIEAKIEAKATQPAPLNDWIADPKKRAYFWAQTKELGFTNGQVHALLGVERMGQFRGSLDHALDRLHGTSEKPAEAAPFTDEEPAYPDDNGKREVQP
jgi:hypothetical protein